MKKLLALSALSTVLVVAALFVEGRGAQAGGPPNDNFAAALVIASVGSTTSENTADASNEGNDPDLGSCVSATPEYGHSVWFQFTPVLSQTVDIDTFGSTNYDTVLAVFTGSKGSLSPVACNDDASGGGQSAVKVTLTQGVVYHILVGAYYTNAGGTLQFNITPQDELFFDDSSLKCYQAKLAKRSARFQPQHIFTFDANFEFRTNTTVQSLSLYCNQAGAKSIPERGPDVAGGFHSSSDFRVTCYKARDDEVFPGARVFAQNEFFGDQKLTVGRLASICVLAAKQSGQLPDFKHFEGQILRCYTARPVKGGPRPDPVRAILLDQFDHSGDKVATLVRPVSYCTLGGKNDVTCVPLDCGTGGDEPDPRDVAVVCYSIRQASFRPFDIHVIDQFIDQQFVDPLITIKKADRYCVPSVKKPPLAENDDFKNATKVNFQQVPTGACAATFDFCPFDDHAVTMNATRARNDPPMVHCESVTDHVDYGHSVWYTFRPVTPQDTDVDIDTDGSTYDTVLAVYTGSKGSLTQIACNDNDPDEDVLTSELELDLDVGQKYFIMVGSKDRSPGGKLKFHLEDSCDIAGPCD